MGFVVKNTTKCGVLDLLCPHTCRGCGRLGEILCGCCKNNIDLGEMRICPLCKEIVASSSKICVNCEMPFGAVFVGGWKEGVLGDLVKEYKYKAVRAIGEVLVEILDKRIGKLEGEVVVVPLPTIGRHVRERGFDHTWVLGKKLAKQRGWRCERILERAADTVQVGAQAVERQKQAEKAYMVGRKVDPVRQYLLLDDVWTTGASLLSAAKMMKSAGAKVVLAAVVVTGR